MTTTPITAARLQEIAALCEAATPGPWSAGPHCETVDGPSWPVCTIAYDDERRPVLDELDPGQHVHQDARFIAASRTAIPEILAEIARLQGEVAAAQSEAKTWFDAGCKAIDEMGDSEARILRGKDARIAALESGLREACDGWEDQWRGENNEEPPPDLAGPLQRLRALADGASIKETT